MTDKLSREFAIEKLEKLIEYSGGYGLDAYAVKSLSLAIEVLKTRQVISLDINDGTKYIDKVEHDRIVADLKQKLAKANFTCKIRYDYITYCDKKIIKLEKKLTETAKKLIVDCSVVEHNLEMQDRIAELEKEIKDRAATERSLTQSSVEDGDRITELEKGLMSEGEIRNILIAVCDGWEKDIREYKEGLYPLKRARRNLDFGVKALTGKVHKPMSSYRKFY